jgi:hypothetical protein
MPRLPTVTSRQLIEALQRIGFEIDPRRAATWYCGVRKIMRESLCLYIVAIWDEA